MMNTIEGDISFEDAQRSAYEDAGRELDADERALLEELWRDVEADPGPLPWSRASDASLGPHRR